MIRERYSHKIADEKKRRKHKKADKRLQARSKLTNKQQLAKLDAGGYIAKKERARLGG